jgi:hypothetical protein
MRNMIRMRLKNNVTSKLAFVKLIKDCTGIGLKEAKWKADDMCENFKIGNTKFTEIELSDGVIRKFQDGLRDIGIDCYMTGGLQWERDFKMLSLGLGDNNDYSNFIIEYVNSIPREQSQKFIGLIVDKLSKKDLEEIFSNISKEIVYDSSL